jgi:hypothetical protein
MGCSASKTSVDAKSPGQAVKGAKPPAEANVKPTEVSEDFVLAEKCVS